MEELGILILEKGELLYSNLLYIDPFSGVMKEVLQVGKHEELEDFYYCYVDEDRVKIHRKLLGSLVVLRGDGTTLQLRRKFVTDANQFYMNGQRAIWFEKHFDYASPTRKAHEVCIVS